MRMTCPGSWAKSVVSFSQTRAVTDGQRDESLGYVTQRSRPPSREAPALRTHSRARHLGGPFSYLEHDMPEQILAKLDAMQTAIASLRAEVGGLQSQVATKADSAAVTSLSNSVTAQGSSITTLSSRIASSCGCNKAAATAESALDTTRIQSANNAVTIDFRKGVITISHPSGTILLEGGQVFVNETSVASAAITTEVTARASADEALCSRIGAMSTVINDSDPADVVRQVIRSELQPGGLLHRR